MVILIDAVLTTVFFADFGFRLVTARSPRKYFFRGFGWLDLLAAFPVLRILRIVRIVEIGRWLRRMGRQELADELSERRAAATFLFTIWLTVVVIEVSGCLIFAAESGDPNANIKTAGDSVWWGLVTITTVGYGDRFPVTPEGRLIGVMLLFAGIALFTVLTGFIANSFLAPRRRRRLVGAAASTDTRAAIESVRDLLDEQDARAQEIRQRLDDLERSLKANGEPAAPSNAAAAEVSPATSPPS